MNNTDELTELQAHMVAAMRGQGWLSRTEINAAIGRPTKHMTGTDVNSLEALVTAGHVQRRLKKAAPINPVYEYCVKDN